MLAWTGVDRAVQAIERFGLDGPLEQWKRTRRQIHDQVCDRGFDPERGTLTQAYGSAEPDARCC